MEKIYKYTWSHGMMEEYWYGKFHIRIQDNMPTYSDMEDYAEISTEASYKSKKEFESLLEKNKLEAIDVDTFNKAFERAMRIINKKLIQ